MASLAVLRGRLPHRSWCFSSQYYLRGRTASPEVHCLFAAGSSGLAYLLSLLLRAARSQELTLTSSAVLRRRLPYRSWCIYSKSYLRGRTASPEVTCPLRPAPPAKHTCFHSSCEQHSLPGVGLTVAGLSSDEPPAHRSWRPDASLLPRIKSRSLMSIVSSGIGFLF